MFAILAQIALGYVYATAMEWVVHCGVYHELAMKAGKRFGGALNFHLREHHRDTRRHGGIDPAFASRTLGWDAHGREAFGLLLVLAIHLPLAWIAPGFFGALVAMAGLYHYCHRRSHVDPEWCKRALPWHWEHHFGKNPHANYCLTSSWFDSLVGTRQRFPELFEERPAEMKRAA